MQNELIVGKPTDLKGSQRLCPGWTIADRSYGKGYMQTRLMAEVRACCIGNVVLVKDGSLKVWFKLSPLGIRCRLLRTLLQYGAPSGMQSHVCGFEHW